MARKPMLTAPCRACGQREAGPGFCGPCGKEAQENYEANAKRLAVAEARAAYWKASFQIEMAKKADGFAEDYRVARDRARERLRALGAEP